MGSFIINKIVSSGQSGVEQGALDFALEYGIACGGWCAKDRFCEFGEIPLKYPVHELPTKSYSNRAEKNLNESDGTLILFRGGLPEEIYFLPSNCANNTKSHISF